MLLLINKALRRMLLPAFLLVGNMLFSQIQKDTLSAIISYGLRVYANDTFSFGPDERATLETIRQNSSNLDESVELLKTNSSSQLKKVGGNVEKWLDKGNASTGYEPLVKAIEETLTNGGDGPAAKEWRKKNVPPLFTVPVNTYLKGISDEPESEETSGLQTAGSLQPDNTQISQTTGGNTMLSTIALILSILSVTGVAYLFFLFSNRLKDGDASRKRQRADVDQLKADVEKLFKNSQAATGIATTPAAAERLQQLEAKIALFEKGLKPTIAPAPPRKTAVEPKTIAEPIASINPKKAPAEPEPEIKTVFAKRPDLDNGFKQTDFSTSQNGEQAYQVEVNGNTATFMIVNDASSQKYALSNYRYYLEKACVFLNEPMPNCRIDTKEQGELTKVGTDWIIQKKALIEFV